VSQAGTWSATMILVTGATGHVGRAVLYRLASLGHDVVAMVRDVQAASRRLPPGIALRVADYEDASALKRALAGIDDGPSFERWRRERSHAPPSQRHRGSYGDQHPAYYFDEHRRYRRVVAILLLARLPRRRAPTSGLQCAFDHPQMWLIFRLYSQTHLSL
jgi:NAD(P)-dependent dehydrogenase (short-subunit alcohol dehydrogenase family)